MAKTDKARAAAPYVQRLLSDQDVQERIAQALRSGRAAYGRTRGKSANEAIGDKKLQRRAFESVAAAREAWVAVGQPPPRRRRRVIPGLLGMVLLGVGVAAALKSRQRDVPLPVSAASNGGSPSEHEAVPQPSAGAAQ